MGETWMPKSIPVDTSVKDRDSPCEFEVVDAIWTSVTPALCTRPEKMGVMDVSMGAENLSSDKDGVDICGRV